MNADETVGLPDVIDMCEEWLRLDFPVSREGGPAVISSGRCLDQPLTKRDESSYRPLPPNMQGA